MIHQHEADQGLLILSAIILAIMLGVHLLHAERYRNLRIDLDEALEENEFLKKALEEIEISVVSKNDPAS